jgi:hypothetical protein
VTELFDFAGSTDSTLLQEAEKLFTQLPKMSFEDRVATINALRMAIHKHSPFSSEPVDYVQWVKTS